MTSPSDFRELCAWESTLREGDMVLARWTSCYNIHQAKCRIVRINEKSMNVQIIDCKENYPAGWRLTVPRTTNTTQWSWNRGVFPLHQYSTERQIVESSR